MQVELVEHGAGSHLTGIGRYTSNIYEQLQRFPQHVTVHLTRNVEPPLAQRFGTLRNVPVGVCQHRPGTIVHFQQIRNCGQMLWNPTYPAVATVHDLGTLVWPDEKQMMSPINQFILYLALLGLTRVNRLIAVSEFTRQTILHHFRLSPDRVHTVHSGIDGTMFRPIPDARQRLATKYHVPDTATTQLLYVGSERPRKNIGTLLQVVALLRQELPNVQLLKVGKPGSARLRAATNRQIAHLKLTDAVQIFEDVPNHDLPLFYNAADMYLHPSFLEGFGFPVLEALACGTPVVCANTSSLPEIGGDAVVLVEPTDVAGFVQAVLGLLRDPARRALLRERGRQRAKAFNWTQTALATLAVYHRVAQQQ